MSLDGERQARLRERLVSSCEKGATHSSLAVLSLLAVSTYLGITALRTDHLSLLTQTKMDLPFITSAVPPWHFYVYAPLILLVGHGAVIIQQLLLAKQWKRNREILCTTYPPIWALVPPAVPLFPFFRSELARGWRILLRVNYALVMATPAIVLFLMQLMFLPYHDSRVTSIHAVVISIDLFMLLALWAAQGPPRITASAGRWVLVCAVTVLIATADLGMVSPPPEGRCDRFLAIPIVGLRFHRQLDVRGEVLNGLNLSGRDLSCANLERVRFIGVDLGGADLSYSRLARSNMQGVRFDYADTDQSWRADFTGSDLREAVLSHIDASRLRLRGADLRKVTATATRWARTDLLGARFDQAVLDSADFDRARLAGASFRSATGHRTSFRWAEAVGASFESANLPLADFRSSDLTMANFDHAELPLTRFEGSGAAGADFFHANLTGASGLPLVAVLLRGATLTDVSFCSPEGPSGPPYPNAVDLRQVDSQSDEARAELSAWIAGLSAEEQHRARSRLQRPSCFPEAGPFTLALVPFPPPSPLEDWTRVDSSSFHDRLAAHLVDIACEPLISPAESAKTRRHSAAAALARRIGERHPSDRRLQDALIEQLRSRTRATEISPACAELRSTMTDSGPSISYK